MTESPQLAVGAIAVADDALLMVKRGTPPDEGLWSVPGGRVEAGETLATAVVREVAEETGLAVVCDRFVGFAEILAEGIHAVVLDFEVIIMDEGDPVAGSDAAAVAWVPIHAVCERPLVTGLAEFLSDHGIIETLA
jgi:ADP-ribose pyrophosphatase YjhB (NUDIX family)